jgi:hypothetical protein
LPFISPFFFYTYPNAIARAVGSSPVLVIVIVSLPPSLVSVKLIFVPAVNFASKKLGVVSFADTETLTSVSDCIAIHADPDQTFKAPVDELKYNAPVANALPSLSTDGAEDLAPK